jgi:hypothetical protein
MSGITPQAQAVIDAFGHQPGVTADQVHNLQAVITASPALTDEVNRSVAAGHLQHIVPLTNPNAGGEYSASDHSMRLPLSILSTPAGGARYDTGEPTFVLGHELQHSFNNAATAQAYTDFGNAATAIAQSHQHDHDYTTAIGNLISANRRDEAGAEISGWNAVVSAARQQGGATPTMQEIYERNPGRMDDFIDVNRTHVPPSFTLKPNLQVNADMTMDTSAHNLAGMGQNFFDKPRPHQGLGFHGNSDYPNYYGSYAIGAAVQYERAYNPPHPGVAPAEMSVNMAGLHLSRQQVEQNGIDFGANTHQMPFQDKSTTPPTPQHFDHTASTHAFVPLPPNVAPSQVNVSPPNAPELPRLDRAGHPDHALYEQTRDAVHRLDAQHHRTPDQRSDNLAAALVVAARSEGLREVNHVILNDDASRAFAVQGDLNSPLKQTAQVQTAQALNASVEQSSQAWQQAVQGKAQDQAAQAQHVAQQPAQPGGAAAPPHM